MKKDLLAVVVTCIAALTPWTGRAAVTLTFNTTTEGFQSGFSGGSSFSFSSGIGNPAGSMKITGPSGFQGDIAELHTPDNNAAFFTELQNAASSGGTLSFDFLAIGTQETGTPTFLQVVVASNSKAGSFLSNNLTAPVNFASSSTQLFHFSLPIFTSGSANDGHFVVDPSGGFAIVEFGLNSDATSVTGYIDNVSVSSVPEPSVGMLLLGGAGIVGLVLRSRRLSA